MNLQPVRKNETFGNLFARYKLGPAELGRCVAPRQDPRQGDCGQIVVDDSKGYADLDGAPFKSYVCSSCAGRLLRLA